MLKIEKKIRAIANNNNDKNDTAGPQWKRKQGRTFGAIKNDLASRFHLPGTQETVGLFGCHQEFVGIAFDIRRLHVDAELRPPEVDLVLFGSWLNFRHSM